MTRNLKPLKIVCELNSAGGSIFLRSVKHGSLWRANSIRLDTLNNPIWTGKRSVKQTEVSAFVKRYK